MPRFPCLKRALIASHKVTATRLHLWALHSGRYEQVHREMTAPSVQALLDRPYYKENGEEDAPNRALSP